MAASCQICFEPGGAVDDVHLLLTDVCGYECAARVCRECILEHIQVSLNAAFTGMLPHIRCPICLKRMGLARWQQLAQDQRPALLEKYHELCKSSCSFQSPCCHNETYSHMPPSYHDQHKEKYHKSLEKQSLAEFKQLQLNDSKLLALNKRVDMHRQYQCNARELLSWVETEFGAKAEKVFNHIVREIDDPERRADLTHAFYSRQRNIKTHCHQYWVCYVCKRSNEPHGEGEPCDSQPFDPAESMLKCRSCHVWLVKVEGCDSVRCVCGFGMDWEQEIEYREWHTRKLLPVDLYNEGELFAHWAYWHVRFNRREIIETEVKFRYRRLLKQIPNAIKDKFSQLLHRYMWQRRLFREPFYNQVRAAFVARMTRTVRTSIRKWWSAAVCWWRFKRSVGALKNELRLACALRAFKHVREPLKKLVNNHILVMRKRKVLHQLVSKHFWRHYYLFRPAEREEIKAEESGMLSIGMADFDD